MWTAANRALYARKGLRYPSDLTDAEWVIIKPLIPPAKRGGRKREADEREIVNAQLYILETGCPWGHLPKAFPPKSTVSDYFDLWSWDGALGRIHDTLLTSWCARKRGGRQAPQRPSWTAKASNRRKKGGAD